MYTLHHGGYTPPGYIHYLPTLGIPASDLGRLTVLVNGAPMTGVPRRPPGL